MAKQLTCKMCKGNNFKQVNLLLYRCLDCGKEKSVSNKSVFIKKKSMIPKESISIDSKFAPVTTFCENCGKKIDRLGSPTDFKRFKIKWKNHVCIEQKNELNEYL